jgi:NAD(P)H-hydrate epimerase
MSLPMALYSVAQVRNFDRHAIEVLGIPGYTLMQRAGAAAWQLIRQRWPRARRITVVTGGGNNGGDGFVVARLMRDGGCAVRLLALAPPGNLVGDARRACGDYIGSGGTVEEFSAASLEEAELIVDALLGTGARAPLRDDYATAIRAINAAGRPVLALDLPSGLDADRGAVIDVAIKADATISFVALKTGLLLDEGPAHCGALQCDDLQIELPAGAASRPQLLRLQATDIAAALPPRARAGHKGDYGRVLIIGGGPGMPGAAQLAGEACLRVGAGLVTLATRREHAAEIAAARPELICRGVDDAAALQPLLAAADVVAVGPGLGTSDWARALHAAALACGKPLVVDADALNLLAVGGDTPPAESVLTPHPGEAARLLGVRAADVQRDRLQALLQLQARTGAIVVLKGAGTLLATHDEIPAICEHGNPGMASAGMGDVLTGAIAGILGQCRNPWRAARAGVLAHALAGDDCARISGARGLLAAEVAAALTARVNARRT